MSNSNNVSPEVLVSKHLKEIMEALEDHVTEVAGQEMCISLCVYNTQAGTRMNYISNADRQDVIKAWTSLIQSWSEGMPDVAAHTVN